MDEFTNLVAAEFEKRGLRVERDARITVASSDGYLECACGCRNSVTKGCAWRRCDRCSAVLDPSNVSIQESRPEEGA